MCGIFAICHPHHCPEGKWFDLAKAQELSSRHSHRGPDFHGSYQSPTTGDILCHERLAIVDLHCTHPIQGSDPTQQVIHNGEIYNHAALHRDEFGGRQFRTHCDSEVIIHLYDKYRTEPEKVCQLLDGVFAFALCYGEEFMAARDPIGVKQMYYGRDGEGRWFFGSEMKTFEELCGPTELAPFPPGHYFTPATGFVQYYSPSWFHWEAALGPPDTDTLRQALIDATHKRLMTDAPMGALLSGGLDSSLVCAIAAREYKRTGLGRLKTFSIGLDATAPDLVAARKIADFLGTEHYEFHFSVDEGMKLIDKLVWHLESYDVTTIRASTPMYFLSQAVSQLGVKVVLSGEGADEVFGGYLYFHNAPSDEEFQKECIRRVSILSRFDCLRADKSCYAHALESRVPFLDKAFLQVAMSMEPHWRRPLPTDRCGGPKVEKFVLRRAFEDHKDPFLPAEILWRQKEQFSDGVGYGWIDQLRGYCERQVTDEEMARAGETFPHNTPSTKEAYYIRRVFHKHFPSEKAAQTVEKWVPKWQKSDDPSGRANAVHVDAVGCAGEQGAVKNGHLQSVNGQSGIGGGSNGSVID